MTSNASLALLCILLVISQFQGQAFIVRLNELFNTKAGCELTFADFPDKEPVFLKTDHGVIEPAGSAITLKANEEVIVACPGAKNTLLVTGDDEDKAKCVKGDVLKVGSKEYALSVLNCTKAVAGEVDVTTIQCGNKRGVVKNIGHNVAEQFDVLFNVCYEDARGEAIYAEHVVYGSAIKNTKKDSTRPGFKTPGLGPGVAADVAYKQATQKATFSSILGSSELAEQYINSKSFLARGHLAPDGDFVYISSQYSSYFYINTVPQWQAVNNGNWKSLEFAVRNLASNTNKNIKVWTGGHEILRLEDVNGDLQDIYLVSKSKLPVPKYSWKVVQDPDTKKAIGFVTVNNPFINSVTNEDIFCTYICQKSGWGAAGWTNVNKGYTYCCDVNQLRRVIKTIPDIGATGILETKTSFYEHYILNENQQ